ncbi:MAG TPA: PHP domain-containing protein, partial [Saprospiraceae bacterium]|nr:PHP domain-containing protein [Saprospiraceae bacterium]
MFFAHTYFSLKYGVFSPAELVQCAGGYGVDTLVLTDINNTSCAFDFIVKCRNANIRPLLGI